MNPSRIFIERPVATTLLTIAVALVGISPSAFCPCRRLPQVDFPTITVAASLPGASPDIMASAIATPLERQFGHIAGITEMTSYEHARHLPASPCNSISAGISTVPHAMWKPESTRPALICPPTFPPTRPIGKSIPADSPILVLGLQSDVYGVPTLYDEASTVIAQRISQISGVGQVIVVGASFPAVRVELNPASCLSYGISLPSVQRHRGPEFESRQGAACQRQLTVGHRRQRPDLQGGRLQAAGDRVLTTARVVRLTDVADVVDSQQTRAPGRLPQWQAFGKPDHLPPAGCQHHQTVDAIKAAIPSLEASIPRGQHLITVLDRTLTIRASVSDIERTLVISVLLVIAVVFIFLRNVYAPPSFPPSRSPSRSSAPARVMYLCGFSLDNLSLMALAIASGFVVDDAIVVMENITRHLEERHDTGIEAALQGAQEIGFTVFSISISLIAVFIPMLLMGGIIGRLFREFAMTLSSAILVSMVDVAHDHADDVLARPGSRKDSQARHGCTTGASGSSSRCSVATGRSLSWVLDHPGADPDRVFCHDSGTRTSSCSPVSRKDSSRSRTPASCNGGMQGPQDTSFYSMRDRRCSKPSISSNPIPVSKTSWDSPAAAALPTRGSSFIALKPLNERKQSAEAIINRLAAEARARLRGSHVPAARSGYPHRRHGSPTPQYQYTLQAETTRDLQKYGPTSFLSELRNAPGFEDVNTDQQNNGLQALLTYRPPHRSAAGHHASGARQHSL